MTYKEVLLGDIADVQWGDTSTTKAKYTNDGYKAFSASGNDGNLPYYDYDREGIVLSAIGAACGRFWYTSGKWSCIKNTIRFWSIDENICLTKYLFYAINPKLWIISGSAQPFITLKSARNYRLRLPDLKTQKKIVRIFSALDQKIELNSQQNKILSELGRQLYLEKFEKNNTIKKVELKNFFPVVTGKKDANASSKNGKYPFFTCSKTVSKIDDYAFDGSAILLAGNGDFNVKFYRGKFDVYQRTYVLIPSNSEYLGFLYWAILSNMSKITAGYRGSVIRFITKGNIESFKIPFANNEIVPIFMKYLEKIEKNNQENETLANLRDSLLPKLISNVINLERD